MSHTDYARPPTTSWDLTDHCVQDFSDIVRRIAAEARSACDVGGGARPLLELDFIAEHDIDYTVLDISADELAKAPDGYRKLQADIAGDLPEGLGGFGLIFSKMLAEHIEDPHRFHRNVLSLLEPGGVAVHLFPTLYAPVFVVNKVLPTAWSRWLLLKVSKHRHDAGLEGKFPAFYAWCRGPSQAQLQKLRSVGFEVVEYRGYFGTPGYYRPLRLAWLDTLIATRLVRRPRVTWCAYAIAVLRRPAASI
jgi:SAM-dependent methyltransferase